ISFTFIFITAYIFQMPYALVKAIFDHSEGSFTKIVMDSREFEEIDASLFIGYQKRETDEYFSVPLSAMNVLNILEMQGWKVVGVTGPETSSGVYMWTLHKERRE
ncbi:hypothetical protein PENTCL1PPCAC_18841, partial [Pristionchus entomophagus]